MTHLSLGSSSVFCPIWGRIPGRHWGACNACLGRTHPSCLGKSATCLGRNNARCLGRGTANLRMSTCTACIFPWLGTSTACLRKISPNCLGRSAACAGLIACTACPPPWLGTRAACLGNFSPNFLWRSATWLGRTYINCLGRCAVCLGLSTCTPCTPRWLGTNAACLGKVSPIYLEVRLPVRGELLLTLAALGEVLPVWVELDLADGGRVLPVWVPRHPDQVIFPSFCINLLNLFICLCLTLKCLNSLTLSINSWHFSLKCWILWMLAFTYINPFVWHCILGDYWWTLPYLEEGLFPLSW